MIESKPPFHAISMQLCFVQDTSSTRLCALLYWTLPFSLQSMRLVFGAWCLGWRQSRGTTWAQCGCVGPPFQDAPEGRKKRTSVDWSVFFFWYPKIHDVSIETDNCCEILGPKPSKATGFPHSLSILFLPKKISIGIKSWEIAEGFPTMPSRIVWSASKGFGSWRPAVAKWPFDPFWNEVNYMWKSMKI